MNEDTPVNILSKLVAVLLPWLLIVCHKYSKLKLIYFTYCSELNTYLSFYCVLLFLMLFFFFYIVSENIIITSLLKRCHWKMESELTELLQIREQEFPEQDPNTCKFPLKQESFKIHVFIRNIGFECERKSFLCLINFSELIFLNCFLNNQRITLSKGNCLSFFCEHLYNSTAVCFFLLFLGAKFQYCFL